MSCEPKTCRTKYLGDWSAACILGLLTGLAILIMQRYMSADAVHQLLTFNPADFFTCALSWLCACKASKDSLHWNKQCQKSLPH